MNSFESDRVEELKRSIVKEYQRSLKLNKILNPNFIPDSDGLFIKVYVRNLLDRIWFRDPSYYPAFDAIGGAIARGETLHFVKRIDEEIEVQHIHQQDIDQRWLSQALTEISGSSDGISILASFGDLYTQFLANPIWRISYDYDTETHQIIVDDKLINLFGFHKENVESDLIILNKNCCNLIYVTYGNENVLNQLPNENTLFINIEPYSENNTKFDLLSFSTIKIRFCERQLIKRYLLSDVSASDNSLTII